MKDRITSSYLHHLQSVYCNISDRGICIDPEALEEGRRLVAQEIRKNLSICEAQWNCHVFIGAANAITDPTHPHYSDQVNLNASAGEKMLLKKLQNLGYKLVKIAKKNEEGEYESKYSTGELVLQKALAANQFGFPGGDPAIRAVLQVRELSKLKNSYLSSRLYKSRDGNLLYLSSYNVVGTLTGRRSSKKHTFGYGNNAQNFPKHGRLSKIFRSCLVARPGNMLLMVDQKSAEEWPVNALARNYKALDDMRAGVNRHIRRAAGIFNIPEYSRTEKDWKSSIEYYLGKRTGHANNYGMRGQRMSDSLAQEGHSVSAKTCDELLAKLNYLDPSIQGVFHTYVRDRVNTTRILSTPFGRERQFLSLRPNDANYKVFNEAYAYIPQSVVADNTGFAVAYDEDNPSYGGFIVQEGHDSIVKDVKEDADVIWTHVQSLLRGFDRTITFDNGISVDIPIEAELGYNFKDTIKIAEPLSYENVVKALKFCREERQKKLDLKAEQKAQIDIQNVAQSVAQNVSVSL